MQRAEAPGVQHAPGRLAAPVMTACMHIVLFRKVQPRVTMQHCCSTLKYSHACPPEVPYKRVTQDSLLVLTPLGMCPQL